VPEIATEQDAITAQLVAIEEAQLGAQETGGANFVIDSTDSDDC
jgi:hypothetical protein